ncbi:MAG: PA4642 family protein [Reinekea sp.]|nr:PA4642 family protein [Reinekea sp.]
MKRDKKRVEGEQWSEDQLRMYLDFNTYDGTDRDFHCLYRAYTRMNETTFAQFVALFQAEGRNIHATNLEGKTLADILRQHEQSEDYLAVLAV